jgi:putative chitinase
LFPYGKQSILERLVEHQDMLSQYLINTNRRRNMFLAQLAHESDQFKTTREYASGEAYEGRTDLGNTKPGDGRKYRGRGLIQLTGRFNYTKMSQKIGVDIILAPNLVEIMPMALQVSLIYWSDKGLNTHADADNFREVTRRINGGYNGMKDREQYLAKLRKVFPED